MKTLTLILALFILASCSNRVYLYKTENFHIDTTSTIQILPNPNINCLPAYHFLFSLSELNAVSTLVKDSNGINSFEISESLKRAGLKPKIVRPNDTLKKANYELTWQEFRVCKKRKTAIGSMAIKIQGKDDSTQYCLLINKSNLGEKPKINYPHELDKTFRAITTNQKPFKQLRKNDINNINQFNDIPDFPKYQFGLSLGSAFGDIPFVFDPTYYKDYYDKLNNYSVQIGASFDYYFMKNTGIGFNYLHNYGFHSDQNAVQLNNEYEKIGYGKISDQVYFNYFIPTIISRMPFFSYKLIANLKYGVGYLNYRNHIERFGETTLLKAGGLGWMLSAEYDYKLNDHLYLGLGGRFTGGSFKTYTIFENDFKLETPARFTRVELGLSLKFIP